MSRDIRVENSVCQVARYYGLIPQCFATLTCIIITLKNSDGEVVSLVERVNSRSTNLDKVYQVHTLIEKIYLDTIMKSWKIDC